MKIISKKDINESLEIVCAECMRVVFKAVKLYKGSIICERCLNSALDLIRKSNENS